MPSIVTGIIGGIQGAHASHDAADAIKDAYKQAGQEVIDATNKVNPQLADAKDKAINWVTNGANFAQQAIGDASGRAQAGMTTAVTNANDLLNPYIATGSTANSKLSDMVTDGTMSHQFDQNDFYKGDPGYAFRLQEGQKALQRAAAARGAGGSGGTGKALAQYSQNFASNEYQNAFNRFMAGRQQTYDMLSGLSHTGLLASDQSGRNSMTGAQYNGNTDMLASKYAGDVGIDAAKYGGGMEWLADKAQADNTLQAAHYDAEGKVGAGKAEAAGDLGAANSWNGMLSGIGAAADSAIAGGFGGGGGFSWGNAGRGLFGAPPVAAPAPLDIPMYHDPVGSWQPGMGW